jgi:hypothetical protein
VKLTTTRGQQTTMPRNQDIDCLTCGKKTKQGFASLNHARVCAGVQHYLAQDNRALFDDGGREALWQDEEEDPGLEGGILDGTAKSIEEHFDYLDQQGTLDVSQVLRYLGWGRLVVSAKEKEVFLFLRSVEMGGGASDASVRASLDYVRSLGGRGIHLPKTVRTCWKRLEKVRLFVIECL